MSAQDTPASSGRPGPGETTMRSGRRARISSTVQRVVPDDDDVPVERREDLDEVERERVVVVEDEDHGNSPALSTARMSARALFSHSSASDSASESATIPAPACTWSTPFATTAVRIAIATSRFPAKSR